jgi:hypothetical protein
MDQQNLYTSSFKYFLIKYFIPASILIAVAAGLFTFLFERKVILGSDVNGAYKVNRIINPTPIDEIAILGSSRAEGAFVPSILGKPFFNYGLSGAQDNVILFFIKEELRKNKTTTILINFDPEGLDSSIGDISYYLYNASYEPVKQLLGKDYRAIYAIPVVKYYGSFEIYSKYYLNSKLQLTKVTDHGGNFEKNVLTANKFKDLVEERLNTKTVFKNDASLAAELLSLIKSHPERKFVFVLTPCHPSYFVNFGNQNELYAYLKSLQENKNVDVLDMSKMPYPDSLYINTTHLNYTGAKVFSSQLRDSLLTKKIIE